MQSSVDDVGAFIRISFTESMKQRLVSQSEVSSESSDQAPLIYVCHKPRAHYPTKHQRVAVCCPPTPQLE